MHNREFQTNSISWTHFVRNNLDKTTTKESIMVIIFYLLTAPGRRLNLLQFLAERDLSDFNIITCNSNAN